MLPPRHETNEVEAEIIRANPVDKVEQSLGFDRMRPDMWPCGRAMLRSDDHDAAADDDHDHTVVLQQCEARGTGAHRCVFRDVFFTRATSARLHRPTAATGSASTSASAEGSFSVLHMH